MALARAARAVAVLALAGPLGVSAVPVGAGHDKGLEMVSQVAG